MIVETLQLCIKAAHTISSLRKRMAKELVSNRARCVPGADKNPSSDGGISLMY